MKENIIIKNNEKLNEDDIKFIYENDLGKNSEVYPLVFDSDFKITIYEILSLENKENLTKEKLINIIKKLSKRESYYKKDYEILLKLISEYYFEEIRFDSKNIIFKTLSRYTSF